MPSPQDLHVVVDWDSVGNLIPITGQKKETAGTTLEGRRSVDEQASVETVQELETDTSPEEPPLTWSDVALYIGAEIVLAARTAVHERLGYTASAGTAPNKVGQGWLNSKHIFLGDDIVKSAANRQRTSLSLRCLPNYAVRGRNPTPRPCCARARYLHF